MILAAGLCLMFAASTQSIAQIKLGVIGGANFNDITGSDIDSEGMTVGYHIGGFVNIGINLWWNHSFFIAEKVLKLNLKTSTWITLKYQFGFVTNWMVV